MPLFSGLTERAAGVLLHPTCLPSRQGVGTLGAGARAFVDFLAEAGMTWWQICPLGPSGAGDSPYSCLSAFAGNPYLVDFDTLRDAGLISEDDLAPLRRLASGKVEYGYLAEHFEKAAAHVWAAAKASPEKLKSLGDFAAFKKSRTVAGWLDDYALFVALKAKHGGKPWYDWSPGDKFAARARAAKHDASLADRIEREKFFQWIFAAQWKALHAYAKSKGVKILGDAPIYVAMDSAEVWAAPELFELDKELRPTFVAGVPPDYFSEKGQLWGNPLYDWKKHKAEDFAWWVARLRANLATFDGLRLDHFRAFHDYWKIPADAKDATTGSWAKGPDLAFFKTVRAELGDALIVAEDLGMLSPGVGKLRDACGLPGMAVLHFAFSDTADNPYLPHHQSPQLVVYPGTHDNDTSVGWYASLDTKTRDNFRAYFGTDGASPHWTLIRSAMTSPARLAIIPMQDLLGLGSEARFNIPGVASGNWSWRLSEQALREARTWIAPNLKTLSGLTGRSHAAK